MILDKIYLEAEMQGYAMNCERVISADSSDEMLYANGCHNILWSVDLQVHPVD